MKTKAQSTLEYTLLAIVIAMSVGLFMKKFDVINTMFKNHFNEASMVVAKAKSPKPYYDGIDNVKGKVFVDYSLHYKGAKENFLADLSDGGLSPEVKKWLQQKLNPVAAQYKGQIYGFATSYISQMVASGQLSPLAAQYALQSLQGYLDYDPSKDDTNWDLIGSSMDLWANMMSGEHEDDDDDVEALEVRQDS